MAALNKYPNFKEHEFLACSPSCSLKDMDEAFMDRLQTARTIAGVPFILTSAYRSVPYELKHGRTGKSLHAHHDPDGTPKARAVDIKCVDSGNRYRIISALIAAGFHGIGVDNTFIHVDDRDFPLIWLY